MKKVGIPALHVEVVVYDSFRQPLLQGLKASPYFLAVVGGWLSFLRRQPHGKQSDQETDTRRDGRHQR